MITGARSGMGCSDRGSGPRARGGKFGQGKGRGPSTRPLLTRHFRRHPLHRCADSPCTSALRPSCSCHPLRPLSADEARLCLRKPAATWWRPGGTTVAWDPGLGGFVPRCTVFPHPPRFHFVRSRNQQQQKCAPRAPIGDLIVFKITRLV